MKHLLCLLLLATLYSCSPIQETPTKESLDLINWKKRFIEIPNKDSLQFGKTYLSVYSEIYHFSEEYIQGLTATISIRNISDSDTIFISKAIYYNTHGELIRDYFNSSIYVLPMETVEIIIDEPNNKGGTGGNFIFDWYIKPSTNKPYFEAVMFSNRMNSGTSFTTRGIEVKLDSSKK